MTSKTTRAWTRDSYLISTDASLIPVAELNAAFASDTFYWTGPLPEAAMREMLANSLCFGLYNTAPEGAPAGAAPKLIGFARLVTDHVSFAYATDVWVDTATQGKGLGRWLVGCVQEVIEGMPHLRRSLLFTGDWERSVPFYEREMKMQLMDGRRGGPLAIMQMKGRGHPDFLDKAA
ncbi:hypothetical protein EsH8_II_001160 [Colletotrichum jinshuiense]